MAAVASLKFYCCLYVSILFKVSNEISFAFKTKTCFTFTVLIKKLRLKLVVLLFNERRYNIRLGEVK